MSKTLENKTSAVFLAAGRGIRFKNNEIPKPLVKVRNKSLIEHSLDSLSKYGINDAIVVVGYLKEQIKEKLGEKYNGISIKYVENNEYLTTDTMYSFYKTQNLIKNNIILLESDLIYDSQIIGDILNSTYPNLIAVSNLTNTGDEVLVSSKNMLEIDKIGKTLDSENILGEFIGISKLSQTYLNGLFNYFEQTHLGKPGRLYCEEIFVKFSKEFNLPLISHHIGDKIWTEIDTSEDLERAIEFIAPKLNK